MEFLFTDVTVPLLTDNMNISCLMMSFHLVAKVYTEQIIELSKGGNYWVSKAGIGKARSVKYKSNANLTSESFGHDKTGTKRSLYLVY